MITLNTEIHNVNSYPRQCKCSHRHGFLNKKAVGLAHTKDSSKTLETQVSPSLSPVPLNWPTGAKLCQGRCKRVALVYWSGIQRSRFLPDPVTTVNTVSTFDITNRSPASKNYSKIETRRPCRKTHMTEKRWLFSMEIKCTFSHSKKA